MAKKITDEVIEQINELYLELKVKKRVAEALGISPSTVTKYIIPGYVKKENRKVIEFNIEPTGAAAVVQRMKDLMENSDEYISPAAAFARDCNLSDEEWTELKELQKGIMI